MPRITTALALLALASACGDGDEADALNVGAQCADSTDCDNSDDFTQTCLPQFTGGYCGLEGCASDLDCPEAAACIAHTDGVDYCFRTCIDKPDCNANREPALEANCSSNVVFVDGTQGRKACVPPSG